MLNQDDEGIDCSFKQCVVLRGCISDLNMTI